MSAIRCHHCRAHLATISALLLTLEAMPRIVDGIVHDHRKHCGRLCPGCRRTPTAGPPCDDCIAAIIDIHHTWQDSPRSYQQYLKEQTRTPRNRSTKGSPQ